MLTPIGKDTFEGNTIAYYFGLTTDADSLPDSTNGSVAFLADTTNGGIVTKFYDEENKAWR